MEECSHETETSNLLFGQSEGTDVGTMAARRFASKNWIRFKKLPSCSTETTRQSRGFWPKQAEYVQHNDVDLD
jgi:hypothetical protein